MLKIVRCTLPHFALILLNTIVPWQLGLSLYLVSATPHCAFCISGCGRLFGLQSFPFSSSLVPLPGGFPLFISRMKFHPSAISFNGKK
jgi:hypothetical protein